MRFPGLKPHLESDFLVLAQRRTRSKTASFPDGMTSAFFGDGLSRCVSNGTPQPPETLTKEILSCWLQNSDKFGTVESIVEWWILEQRIRQTAVQVQAVLEKLVASGLVERWQEADGQIYYRLSRDKEAEARAWVESGGDT